MSTQVSSVVSKNLITLLYLAESAQPYVVKLLLKDSTTALVRALVEVCYNVLYGDVQLSPAHKRTLKPYRNKLTRLVDRRQSIGQKRRILQRLPPKVIKSAIQAANLATRVTAPT